MVQCGQAMGGRTNDQPRAQGTRDMHKNRKHAGCSDPARPAELSDPAWRPTCACASMRRSSIVQHSVLRSTGRGLSVLLASASLRCRNAPLASWNSWHACLMPSGLLRSTCRPEHRQRMQARRADSVAAHSLVIVLQRTAWARSCRMSVGFVRQCSAQHREAAQAATSALCISHLKGSLAQCRTDVEQHCCLLKVDVGL
jgi:hypothetical protein